MTNILPTSTTRIVDPSGTQQTVSITNDATDNAPTISNAHILIVPDGSGAAPGIEEFAGAEADILRIEYSSPNANSILTITGGNNIVTGAESVNMRVGDVTIWERRDDGKYYMVNKIPGSAYSFSDVSSPANAGEVGAELEVVKAFLGINNDA